MHNEDNRKRRLRFRAWHRGTKEMDLIMGTFADRHLDGLDGPALDAFEALIDLPDPEIFNWISGKSEPPQQHAAMIARLQEIGLRPQDYT